jgi:hypothetical protein
VFLPNVRVIVLIVLTNLCISGCRSADKIKTSSSALSLDSGSEDTIYSSAPHSESEESIILNSERTESIMSREEEPRLSHNVQDLRQGVPCDNPRNCITGFVSECDLVSCKQEYNTGYCHVDYSGPTVKPLASCQVRKVTCSASLCSPPTPPDETYKRNQPCKDPDSPCTNPVGLAPCDPHSCTRVECNGLCDEYWIDGRWKSACSLHRVPCTDHPACTTGTSTLKFPP